MSASVEKSPELGSLVDLQPKTQDRETIPREIKTWMEKVEDVSSPLTTVSDISGQPLLQSASPVSPKLVLPLTKSSFVAGFKKTVSSAGRWLSVFILRLIKIKKGYVTFKSDDT
jgi:hypothetical protein